MYGVNENMKQLRPAIALLLTLSILTGIAYPLLITGMAQLFFPDQANGSLIIRNGQILGSSLIGQQFNDPKYFWGRPSATADMPYNASSSGGSNLSVLNPDLVKQVADRLQALVKADPANRQPVPVDLVTSSASGLDPDISVAAAEYQASRVAKARSLDLDQVNTLILQYTRGRILGILGEKTVNILDLNIALDALK